MLLHQRLSAPGSTKPLGELLTASGSGADGRRLGSDNSAPDRDRLDY
jgi:hypothetical protein